MSEEILKALAQLFAIITKQDGGVTENERDFVISIFREDLDKDSITEYLALYDEYVGWGKEDPVETKKKRLTSVKDSVKTLAICRKINKTLTQKQKVVVMIKLLQLVGADRKFTEQRMEIINTVSEVFNVDQDEYKLLEAFILYEPGNELDNKDILIARSKKDKNLKETKQLAVDLNGELIFLRVGAVDMYFVRFLGTDDIVMNGLIIKPGDTNQFSHGSTIKTPKGDALYYSDLVSHFLSAFKQIKLSFVAKDLSLVFPNGAQGLVDVNIVEGPGKLIGIMGASGAGKTTLLNVLAGIQRPTSGDIRINGKSLIDGSEDITGVIGYISQDDLLIEELTVYENLYYNAKLCFAQLSEEEIDKKVIEVLTNLGLDQRKDLKVGSALDKTISGGQRKRLNIALELIREPAVLFVDEPTSGLSSRDSENVIDLLKELSLKGKLIFVVIHQPSSDIYKMFDKMMIMDVGGFPVYYGPPVEAVTYFKRATNQVGSDRGQCNTCGNVNPEQIFNIIDAKVVDEYGEFTNKRKINPQQWNELYLEEFKVEKIEEAKDLPPKSLHIPNKLVQTFIFTKRDLLAKLTNKQYLLINLLEAPVLAFILAFIIKYKNAENNSVYHYFFNENIPVYLMMAIIIALFMGLTVSAEEIIKDRKILKRESFLNLSWNSYLLSKIIILFTLSAIQTFTFTIIGNLILEIKEMTFVYWFVFFSVSCTANIIGLNVSSAFNSAITAYILIPFLIIPQMVLSGLLFNFDKLNDLISTKGKVPLVADIMTSRWAYEAAAVKQYMSNSFEKDIYPYEVLERQSDFKASYWVNELKNRLTYINENYQSDDEKSLEKVKSHLLLLKNEIEKEPVKTGLEDFNLEVGLQLENYSSQTGEFLSTYLDKVNQHYLDQFKLGVTRKERAIYYLENESKSGFDLNDFKNKYFNESLSDLVRNVSVKDRILEHEHELIQQIDPIYNVPSHPKNMLDYRAHFFAPKKHFLGQYFDTFSFNMTVIWLMSLLLYVALYFEWLKKILNSFSKLSVKK